NLETRNPAGGVDALAVAEQQPFGLSEAAAVHEEPEMVLEGGERELRIGGLVDRRETLRVHPQSLLRLATVMKIEGLLDEHAADRVGVADLPIELADDVEGEEGELKAALSAQQRSVKVVEAHLQRLGARSALEHVKSVLERPLGFPEIVGRAQGIAELSPGPGLEVGHLASAVGGGVEAVRHRHRHPCQADGFLRIVVAKSRDALEESLIEAEPSLLRNRCQPLLAGQQDRGLLRLLPLFLQDSLETDRLLEGAGHRLVVRCHAPGCRLLGHLEALAHPPVPADRRATGLTSAEQMGEDLPSPLRREAAVPAFRQLRWIEMLAQGRASFLR